MRLRLVGYAVLITAALASGAAGLISIGEASNQGTNGPSSPQPASHHPGGMDAMSIDMNVAGNTNSVLGAIQTCARINENNLVDADEEDLLAVSRTVASATSTTLTDASGGWLVNQWAGNRVVLTAGTGSGQTRTIASNTANTLTITQAWDTVPNATSSYQIRLNDAIRMDATALGIPAHNNNGTPTNASDDTGGIIAYSFDLTYPAGVSIASQTSALAGVAVLTRNSGSSIFDSSESPPESDGLFRAGALDTGSGIPESGSGVLSRLVVQSNPSAGTAVYPLALSENVHVDASGLGYAPDATNDNALIAINTACPPPDSDSDGWPDAAEAIIGTDPFDNCPDSPTDDAWPADINNDAASDISDLVVISGSFPRSVPPAAARHDIAPDPPDGFVDITDMVRIAGHFGQSCA